MSHIEKAPARVARVIPPEKMDRVQYLLHRASLMLAGIDIIITDKMDNMRGEAGEAMEIVAEMLDATRAIVKEAKDASC